MRTSSCGESWSPKRHSSTASAISLNTATFVPRPSQVAPRGEGSPGHVDPGGPTPLGGRIAGYSGTPVASTPSTSDTPGRSEPSPEGSRTGRLNLHGWHDPAVLAAATFSIFAGFAQFSATASLADIAAAFGAAPKALTIVGDRCCVDLGGTSVIAEIGLSGTVLGLGLGIIRLASLGSLPLAQQADRHGRKPVLLTTTVVALVLTALAAGSPSFWVFVIVLALARPLMSATNAVAGVIAAEETVTQDRAKALAVITVGYGIGAGIPVVLRGVTGGALGFRMLFLLAVPLLLTLPIVARLVEEPARAARLHGAEAQMTDVAKRLGRVPEALRGRLLLLATLTFFAGFLTGPVNTYLFLYAESVAGLDPATFTFVIPLAAASGGLGLIVGVRLADRFGRISTAMWTKLAAAAAGVLTYSAGGVGAIAGYVLTLFIGSSYAPAVGATAAEIFPTSIRATAAGWLTVSSTLGAVSGLLAFGWVAEASGSFSTASIVVSVPVAMSVVGYRFLPETKDLELEESAPEVTT